MEKSKTSSNESSFTDLILSLFRTNNLIVAWGDRLVASLGLTSAGWQVLGAIVEAERSQPVSWLARDLGTSRQNIQRIVNNLAKDDFVEFQINPHHRRAQLVVLTKKGLETFEAALEIYAPQARRLSKDLAISDIEIASKVILELKQRLKELESGKT